MPDFSYVPNIVILNRDRDPWFENAIQPKGAMSMSMPRNSPLGTRRSLLKQALLLLLCVAVVSVAASESTSHNPFTSGCLRDKLPHWDKKRVCNSEDPWDAVALGLCREADIPHDEIRILGYNWETTYFEAFLLQIILSEMLDVPVTVETGSPKSVVSLYDPENQFEFGDSITGQEADAINTAFKYDQDCTKKEPGEICAHYSPELWNVEQDYIQNLVQDGSAQVTSMGTVAYEGLFIPKFTAQRDPSLLSYFGMQGQANRHKLAERFLSPTTFEEYCQQVSDSSCSLPNGVAQRPPNPNSTEGQQFFVRGVYTGHFRKTEMQDCERFPDNCTGHFANYPCGWSTYAEAQMYHLDIALRGGGPEVNGGYHQARLKEILYAANATKSNVLIQWWMPSLPNELLRETEAELVKVQLPFPTQECLNNRHPPQESSCSPDWRVRVGDPRAACDDAALSLSKLISTGLQDKINGQDEAIRSPAYDVLQRFSINEFQLGEIFQIWKSNGSPRDAVCTWAAHNFDTFLQPLVPPSHPRALQEAGVSPLTYASLVLGLLSCALVLVTTFFVYRQQERRVFRYAQIDFLWILLFGGLALGAGATIAGSPASDGTCIAEAWLINIGYTLILVPLIVKMFAIHRLMMASMKMQRVHLKRKNLMKATGLVSATIVIFLVIWTAVDAPVKKVEFEMTDSMTGEGNSIVEVSYYCSSGSKGWAYFSVGWTAVLLLFSSVLAFLSRKHRQEFRESTVLTALIYTHFVVVLLRLVSVFQWSSLSASDTAKVQSILYSIDNLSTIAIYFVPKFLAEDRHSSSDCRRTALSDASVTAWASRPSASSFPAFGSISSMKKLIAFDTITTIDKMSGVSTPDLDADVEEQEEPRSILLTENEAKEKDELKPAVSPISTNSEEPSAVNTAEGRAIMKLVTGVSPPASESQLGRIAGLLSTLDDLRDANISMQIRQDRLLTSSVMALTMSPVTPEDSQRLATGLVSRLDELEREHDTLKARKSRKY